MTVTVEQVDAAIKVAHVVFEVIAAGGTQGVPSGHVYAATMSAFSDVATYESCIDLLVKSKLVRREGLLLFAAAKLGA